MPRLVTRGGVVVDVDDATATLLGADWKPADEPEKKPAPKRTAAKK